MTYDFGGVDTSLWGGGSLYAIPTMVDGESTREPVGVSSSVMTGSTPDWMGSAINKALDAYVAIETAQARILPQSAPTGYIRGVNGQVYPAGTMGIQQQQGGSMTLLLLGGLALLLLMRKG